MTKKLVSFDDQAEPGEGLPAAVKAELNATYGADALGDQESEVRQVLDETFVGQEGRIRGAARPEFMRHPTLGVERVWPNAHEDVTILWTSIDGETVYAQDQGGYFLKSTTGGKTWAQRSLIPVHPGGTTRRFGRKGAFLKLKNGTLLALLHLDYAAGPPMYFARSTDDGMTWTHIDVRALTASGTFLGPTSWCEDPETGYVYYGEYDSTDTQTEVTLYRSTDSGATWSKFYTWPGPATNHAEKVRHIHSVEWDHIAKRILIMIGDSQRAAGIWRVNADGTSVEPLLLNRQATGAYPFGSSTPSPNAARAIGIMPFPDYIAYTADSEITAIMRVPRTSLVTDGVTPTQVEVVRYLNSTAWYAIRASNDGSRWVVSASQEGEGSSLRIDRGTHLYAVEDQGATVFELGTWLSSSSNRWVALSPVGDAHTSGDVFYLRAHSSPRPAVWRCSLLMSSGSPLPLPPTELKKAWVWHTFSSQQVTLEPGQSMVFGFQRVPPGASNFLLYDMGVKALAPNQWDLRVQLQSPTGTVHRFSGAVSDRTNSHFAPSDRDMFKVPGPVPGQDIHFVIKNTSATTAQTGVAYVTFGWGSQVGALAGNWPDE